MRICIISPYAPQTGGVPVHTESLIDTLSGKHEVHLITYGKMGREDDRITIHEIPVANMKFLRGASFFLGTLFKLRSLCREMKFDVIHAQYMHPPGTVAVKFRALFGKNEKIIVTAHGSDLLSLAKGRFGRWMVKKTGNLSDTLICVSDHLAGEALKAGINRKKISVVHNGLDEKELPQSSREKARKVLGLGSEKIVTFAGKLSEAKGADIFLLLAEHLSGRNAGMKFLMIGDGPLAVKLKEDTKKKGLSGIVEFVGPKEHGETLEYMKASDVVVIPSRIEGFGLTALEAALMDVPVIASGNGALPEVLCAESISGNMPHDVMKALNDRKFMEVIVKGNRKKAEKFTLRRMVNETENIYRSAKRRS
ncbi:MAG: glycosyltransferase family 4 protein [Candidatus Aenigmarchaeota archaeon]|nr:glycosyltransferase family 4 protein [Candidatus Aenigmarchaeota archaeon]